MEPILPRSIRCPGSAIFHELVWTVREMRNNLGHFKIHTPKQQFARLGKFMRNPSAGSATGTD